MASRFQGTYAKVYPRQVCDVAIVNKEFSVVCIDDAPMKVLGLHRQNQYYMYAETEEYGYVHVDTWGYDKAKQPRYRRRDRRVYLKRLADCPSEPPYGSLLVKPGRVHPNQSISDVYTHRSPMIETGIQMVDRKMMDGIDLTGTLYSLVVAGRPKETKVKAIMAKAPKDLTMPDLYLYSALLFDEEIVESDLPANLLERVKKYEAREGDLPSSFDLGKFEEIPPPPEFIKRSYDGFDPPRKIPRTGIYNPETPLVFY